MPRGGYRPGAGRKKRSGSPSDTVVFVPAPLKTLPANRTPNGKFLPGVSGNPSGRPKTGERAFLMAQYGADAAVLHERLDALAKHKKTPPHVKAEILKFKIERHSGKASQTIAHEGIPVPGSIAFVVQQQVGAENRT